jgi:cysteine desulfurase/selenocysteine lyase
VTATETIRSEFPILNQKVGSYPLVYFDNAATTQKPAAVVQSLVDYYRTTNANIHRGAHYLAHRATEQFEAAREKVRGFINAAHSEEIIFTSGTTDAINLVAQAWGRKFLNEGDEILLSVMDHHSNIVPWQMVAEERGAVIRVLPVSAAGEWDLEAARQLINPRTKIVAVNHVSNATGTINPAQWMADLAHRYGSLVLFDGAQAVAHMPVDVQSLGCDFYAFSAHKMYGPTGTGVLYGKKECLEKMPPWRGGGEMIRHVSFEKTTYNDLPYKFEAGTPDIAGVIAMGAAVDFMQEQLLNGNLDLENYLLSMATKALGAIPGVRIIGTAAQKVPVLSFVADGVHPYDIGTLLDQQGIAVRTGHHCTEPLWDFWGLPGTVRASFAVYNTEEEVQRFVEALVKTLSMLRP